MMNWLHQEEFEDLSDAFVDDLLNPDDFSQLDIDDDDTTNGDAEDWVAKFKHIEPPPMDVFTSYPSCGVNKLGRVGTVPGLKQSGAASVPNTKVSKVFQSLSPVSVLESSDRSSSPQNSRTQRLTSPVKGTRSKRKRPTTLRFRYLRQFDLIKPEKFTPDESGAKAYYDFELHAKKKRKVSDGIVRRCSHCETTETPQWREGPNGPKTLCNACGVRFRSGRLVPEYRPASSPTFVPFVHSNSHKKIIEMRKKEDGQFHTSMIHGVMSTA